MKNLIALLSTVTFLCCATIGQGSLVSVPGDYSNIAAAIIAAQQDENITEIKISENLFENDVLINNIDQDVIIFGVNNAQFVSINANQSGRHFYVNNNPGKITFAFLNLINGTASDTPNMGYGGSIYSYESDVSINNCTFTNSSSNKGGSIYYENTDNGILELVDCEFNDCSSESGGAVSIGFSLCVEITGCRFNNNSATNDGGAIGLVYDSHGVTLQGCGFYENSAFHGGAISLCSGITVSGSIFDSNTGYEGASLYAQSTSFIPLLTPSTIKDCIFSNHISNTSTSVVHSFHANPIHFVECDFFDNESIEATIATSMDSEMKFVDCIIKENRSESGKLFLACVEISIPGAIGKIGISNSLVCDNVCNNSDSSQNDGLVYASQRGILECAGSTFVHNSTNIGCNSSVGVIVAEDICDVSVSGCDISFNHDMYSNIISSFTTQVDVEYTNIYSNTFGDWVGRFAPFQSLDGNMHFNPNYVDFDNSDYRLKWDSELMDKGDPSSPCDFDLTPVDIGWSPVYPITDIIGSHSGTLDLGWYRVLENAVISDEDLIILAGTVLRFDSGVNASFRAQGSYSGGYNIILGDLEGPRTALVAKDEGDPEELPCTGYSFGTTATAPYLANVEFNGVLFNFAPSMGLGFTRCDVNLDGENIVAMDFENVGLTFSTSDGQVTHFSEATGCGPRLGWVDQMTSAVDVSYVDFPPQEDAFFCNLFNSGTYAGQTILQHNNTLRGNLIPQNYDNIPVLLFDCTVRQHHNQYEDLAAGGVYMADATLHMNNGAMNRFLRIQNYTSPTAMIQGYDTAALINVECGNNSFVDPDITPSNRDFAEGGCENTDWNHNFWGTDCSTPIPTQDIPNMIPSCASAINNLSECPTDVILCSGQSAESDLYVYGEEANLIGNHQAAVAYWTEMLEEFPESKYALSVTGWVKSLGITTLYGEDEYVHVVEHLIDAAQASSGVEPHLSVYEFASAQCVEAYHGNRQGAIAVLDSMALVLKDPDDIKTVTYARLEVDTYPPQGQMNAMAAGDWVQAARNQRQAIRRLQDAMAPGAARMAEEEVVEPHVSVPSSFLLERPVPNPFNPRTRLALQVPAEGDVRVRVYNVQGQVVTTLREGRMRAGRHELVVEAGSWASGVYLARAEFHGQVQTQKLVLVK